MKKKNNPKGTKITKVIERLLNIFIIRSIIFDILIILLGGYFILNPYSGLRGCEIVFSIFLLIFGCMSIFDCSAKNVVKLFNFSLIYGVLSIIFGLLIILNPLALANIVTICFGIWMVISGAVKINNSISLKKLKEDSWSVILGIGILTSLIGILLIFNPFVELYITQVVGIFVIIYAVLDFTNNLLFKKRKKDIIKILK